MTAAFFVSASTVASALFASLLCALFTALAKRFRYTFLWLWAPAFALGALARAFAGLGLWLTGEGWSSDAPLRLAASALAQVLGIAELLFIMLSAWELVLPGRVNKRHWVLVGLLSLVVGLLIGWGGAWDPNAGNLRLILRIGVPYLLDVALFSAACLYLHHFLARQKQRSSRILIGGFASFALGSAICFGLFVYQWIYNQAIPVAQLFGLTDLIFTAILGGSLALWLFDREREHVDQMHQRLSRMELLDQVTGLPNRRHFIAQASLLLESQREVTMLAVAIDGFRAISEDLGPERSEQLLRNAAERIFDSTPEDALLGRMRNEEFAVLTTGMPSTNTADLVARTVLSAFEPPFVVDGKSLLISVSVGVVQFPCEGKGIDRLLALMDSTIATARETGGQQIRHYSLTEQLATRSERAGSLSDVHQALIRGEFELYYQPVIDRDNKLPRVEALLRWHLSDGRVLTPDDFSSALKQPSLAVALDQWVIERSIAQLAEWRRVMPMRLAINLSGAMLARPDFTAILQVELERNGVPPSAVEIELTEQAAIKALDHTLNHLGRLNEMGVPISLDDFGTGYSTLEQLRLLPVQQIKIDRSFVRQLPFNNKDAVIVTALTNLAHGLGVQVIAEGVETRTQRDFLSQLNVDAQQGFLFSRPVPANNVLGTVAGLLSFPIAASGSVPSPISAINSG